ncbi:hypothetical protein F0145_00080 [Adhaeribacter rhizoryzae]|uniref:YcxB family protein n=1 Tax=Adhaeribacter rhizoryzae TaxID=2607907 RepID=A0A5M6DND7_9BACT|nr:hypothetical protein F0145_00080 [Adhaeribacter rhizoryzae]
METIKLNKTIEEEYRQALFLLNFIRAIELKSIRYKLIYILSLTAILVGLSVFGSIEYLIGFYIVLIVSWAIFIINYFIKFRKYKQKKAKLKVVAEENFNQLGDFILEFNQDLIKVTTEKFNSEVKWEYFRAYLEEENTIYILMEQISSTWSFSKQEIGEDALNKLKQIVKEKLPPLKIKNFNA